MDPVDTNARPDAAAGKAGPEPPAIVYVIPLLLFVCAGVTFSLYRDARKIESSWRRADGVVTANKVEVSRGTRTDSYFPKVYYSYETDGQQYSGGPLDVFNGRIFMTYDGADKALQGAYGRGTALTIYYDPGSPGRSSLGVAGSPGPFLPLFFCAAGLATLLMIRRT